MRRASGSGKRLTERLLARRFRVVSIAVMALAAGSGAPSAAQAETIFSALSRAYNGNPDLNQNRASLRARDEEAPKALAGMRPRASISANAGPQYSNVKIPAGRTTLGDRNFSYDQYVGYPRGATLNLSQTLFDGNRTASALQQAESNVFAGRASLRLSEQTIFQNGATAYMNVLRDTAVLSLRRKNVTVLEEQLKQTQDRFQVGEVTRTDVAQAESSLAQAHTDVYAAQAALKTSIASYRQIIGVEPNRLEPAQPVEKLLPKSLQTAVSIAIIEHPSVVAALHQVDAAAQAVKVAEAALAPNLSVNASVSQQYDSFLGSPNSRQFSAAAQGQLNIPLYQGGSEYASIRQAKEQLGQARLSADLQRDLVRSSLVSGYAQLEAAKSSIVSSEAAAKAAEVALTGVREEAKVGQRTTLDVLNAQQVLLNARVNVVIAQRDRVVASYVALAALGRLSAQDLGLGVAVYQPAEHFDDVKDKWFGVTTPDGR
jgi:outer membrane protein